MAIRGKFARSVCGCAVCGVGCYTMPGTCAPGDVAAIAAASGVEGGEAWLAEHFVWSEGVKIMRRVDDGGSEARVELVTIETISPRLASRASSPTGLACVFLDAGGRCSVHAASPFGCAFFDEHMPDIVSGARVRALAVELMADGGEYRADVATLKRLRRKAKPVEERRRAYEELSAATIAIAYRELKA